MEGRTTNLSLGKVLVVQALPMDTRTAPTVPQAPSFLSCPTQPLLTVPQCPPLSHSTSENPTLPPKVSQPFGFFPCVANMNSQGAVS